MSSKLFSPRARTWLAAVAMVSLVTAAIAAGTTSRKSAKASRPQHIAWYNENTSPAPAQSTAGKSTCGPAGEAACAKGLSRVFHAAAEKVLPSVVMITNTPTLAMRPHKKPSANEGNGGPEAMPFGFGGTPFGDLFKNNPDMRRFFKEFHFPTPEMPHRGIGAGSGVIVDPSGVILTNNHVVDGGGRIVVRLQDGREFKAYDIKTDPDSDLAILRIKAKGPLPAARLGNSDTMEVGDWVLALGQPFGLQGTVTAGIISAKNRGIDLGAREEYLQTDAAINPGNSGGPLVNLDGQVIGINTAISTTGGAFEGVGFAIPINMAKWVGAQLMKTGAVHRAYLGVMIQPVSSQLAEQFHVKVHQGVLVTEVQPHTPAAKAGLKPGDVILKYDGKAVSSPRGLQALVERSKIGHAQSLALLRNGKAMTLSVTTAELPASEMLARNRARKMPKEEASSFDKLGIEVENLTPDVAKQLDVNVDHGVVITNVQSGSPADLAGLSTGNVITQANHHAVNSVEDFRKAIGEKPLSQGVLLLVHTPEGARFVALQAGSE